MAAEHTEGREVHENLLGDGDVGQQHELLDQSVGLLELVHVHVSG